MGREWWHSPLTLLSLGGWLEAGVVSWRWKRMEWVELMGIRTHLWACDLNNDHRAERVDVRPELTFGLKVKLSPPIGFCPNFYHSLTNKKGVQLNDNNLRGPWYRKKRQQKQDCGTAFWCLDKTLAKTSLVHWLLQYGNSGFVVVYREISFWH